MIKAGKSSKLLEGISKRNGILDDKDTTKADTLLLLEGPKENLQILRQLNMTHHIDIVEQDFHKKNSVKELNKKFELPVYLGEDIKPLCNTYDLKFCKAEHYKGALSIELATAINSFIDKHSYEVKKNEGEENEKTIKKSDIMVTSNNFFILAPTESFLKTGCKSKNATLFYRDHDESRYPMESDKFVEIYSWGHDYSSNRVMRTIFNNYDYETKEATVSGVNKAYAILFFILLAFGAFSDQFLFPVIGTIVLIVCFYLNNQGTSNILFKKWNEPEL